MKKTLTICALSLILCVSLITGATYALFTSESEIDIAVNSGVVQVEAKADATSAETKQLYGTYAAGADHTFGSVTITDNSVTLDKIVPGDGVKFNIIVTNLSNVSAQYRTKLSVEDNGLFEGLVVKINGESYEGFSIYSAWALLSAGEDIADVTVEIDFPNAEDDSNNKYQGGSCTITFAVEAVQGNAEVTNPVENALNLYTAEDLKKFAASVTNGNSYAGKTVVLANSIDLKNELFPGIGKMNSGFMGTFDGQGNTIRNLKMNKTDSDFTGLFNILYSNGKIQNLTVENADIVGSSSVGTILGGYTGAVENCHVKGLVKVEGNYKVGGMIGGGYVTITDSTVDVTAGSYVKGVYTNTASNREGDNVGGFVGYIAEGNSSSAIRESYVNCSVKGMNVSGTRKVGGFAGYLERDVKVTDCYVDSCEVAITFEETDNYTVDNMKKLYVGGFIGEHKANAYAISGAVKNTTVHGIEATITGAVTGGCRSNDTITMLNTVDATVNVTVVYDLSGVAFYNDGICNATVYTAQGLYILSAYGLSTQTAEAAPYFNDITIAADAGVLDMAGYEWVPLNGFRTKFNGNNVVIKNLNAVTESAYGRGGFFASVQGGVTVENIILENVTVRGEQVGALAGYVAESGTIKNCVVRGTITVLADNQYARDTWDGAGAVIGVANSGSNIQATVAADAVINVDTVISDCEPHKVTPENDYVGYMLGDAIVDIVAVAE